MAKTPSPLWKALRELEIPMQHGFMTQSEAEEAFQALKEHLGGAMKERVSPGVPLVDRETDIGGGER